MASASVLRENLCRFDRVPLVARVPSLPRLPSGARVLVSISKIDLLELAFHAEFEAELKDLPVGTVQ